MSKHRGDDSARSAPRHAARALRASSLDGAASSAKPRAPDARADAFEAQHMRDGAELVHRDKRVSRGTAALLMIPGLVNLVLAVFVTAVNSSASKPLPAAALPFVVAAIMALGLLFMGLGLVFAVVRTVVSEREVHVKFGLWGPRIPLENIRSCKVVDYHWTEFGGWGIRRGRDGTWAYVPGGKRVVELCYVEGNKKRRVLVGVEDPDEMARQINRARRLRAGNEGSAKEEADRDVDREVSVNDEPRLRRRIASAAGGDDLDEQAQEGLGASGEDEELEDEAANAKRANAVR